MFIFILAYIGGVLTIFSPCVLPVLPFIFARSDQSFRRSGLPILFGMALTFTVLASLAAVGGAWLVAVNQYGRYAAMGLLLLLGSALIFPALSERLMRPFVALGGRLQQRADSQHSVKGALLLGIAVGFLWAPCAGPILGLVLAGAALNGANWYSASLLLVFAAGAASSLGLALLAGGRVFAAMKRGLGAEEWVRRGLGVLVVAGVVIIALGWDTRFLARFSFLDTAKTEQALIAQLDKPSPANNGIRSAPPLAGATQWLNSTPLTQESLRGKVVLVDFWTYSCINCLRTLPYLKAWDEKYRDSGLVIIGVHAPEFAFEKDQANVENAVRELGIKYPVAMDNDYAIWNAYKNEYWPAHYLIDAQGKIRHQHFGEGAYAETEQMIQTLLKEANSSNADLANELVNVTGSGVSAAASAERSDRSPETYLGFAREEGWASRESLLMDENGDYSTPQQLSKDRWALQGKWLVSEQSATLHSTTGALSYRFFARDVHLVMGSHSGKPIRFKVTLDGKVLNANHGVDTDAQGFGKVNEQRLYQLVRQAGALQEHTLRIEFLDADAEVFAFTFG
ncbi:MAG: cytochrome c biogenesis protein DipZ [Sideroxydans sp.]|nr:cytochrome c biogenesis protein DipZ [Sideroxydans sp.]